MSLDDGCILGYHVDIFIMYIGTLFVSLFSGPAIVSCC